MRAMNDRKELERKYKESVRLGLTHIFDNVAELHKIPEKDKLNVYIGLSNLALQAATQAAVMKFCPRHFLQQILDFLDEETSGKNKDGEFIQ